MRRGGCARRAMLGAVAAGALLGAARGAYTINLDNQEDDGGSTERTDDEYKVKKTSGLEIVIGPSAGSVYDIAPAGTGLDIEVVAGPTTRILVPTLPAVRAATPSTRQAATSSATASPGGSKIRRLWSPKAQSP